MFRGADRTLRIGCVTHQKMSQRQGKLANGTVQGFSRCLSVGECLDSSGEFGRLPITSFIYYHPQTVSLAGPQYFLLHTPRASLSFFSLSSAYL